MNLSIAEEGKVYIIQRIETDDEELDAFLFSLGCYAGEPITVVSRRKGGCTVSIKDGRYNIDNQLAEAIIVWAWLQRAVRWLPFDQTLAAANTERNSTVNAVRIELY